MIDISRELISLSVSPLNNLETGFCGESILWKILDSLEVPYKSNPKQYEAWLETTNTGYDLIVYGKKVEVKFLRKGKRLYPSWFKRDWLSKDCDIIVTSFLSNLSEDEIELAREKGIEIMSYRQFADWVFLEKLKNEGNKLYLNKNIEIRSTNNKRSNILSKSIVTKVLTNEDSPPRKLLTLLNSSVQVAKALDLSRKFLRVLTYITPTRIFSTLRYLIANHNLYTSQNGYRYYRERSRKTWSGRKNEELPKKENSRRELDKGKSRSNLSKRNVYTSRVTHRNIEKMKEENQEEGGEEK